MEEIRNLNDEKLMNLYAAGEYEAFEILYSRYKTKISSYLNRKVFNQDMREEVFQDIFMKLHRTRSQYSDQYLFAQWIFTITRTTVLDYLKKKKISTVDFFENELVCKNVEKEVEIDLESLSDREKAIIEMRYFSDHDYEEIAQKLNLSTSNVRKIASRAIAALKGKKV
ncbi:RNA polymerase sigma factor [Bacteriovorax sp. Seq25_V]|uniref:RNA polymerase sigma factor n=1 Tax=Bacteriovorax sp. Seq25_V TaxID=1201288 RepID=UPI000389ED89|nr:sigma-70 family RNA polymerase sigma factor [Bacteriovorax sp. Seq25_V]EQC45423.1 sigma-70, region 4 [Bacteriovorax sp. Seq25_V]